MKVLAIIEVTPETMIITMDLKTKLDTNGMSLDFQAIKDFVLLLENCQKSAEEVIQIWNKAQKS